LSGGDYVQYAWSTGDTGPVILVSDSGSIALQVTNARGCTGRDTIRVRLDCLGEPLLPNAFTPNGDGKNDVWAPAGPLERIIAWNVYDRWGNAIILNQGPYDRWDGSLSGKPAPSDTYVCLLRYLAADGSEQQKTGRITLLY
jgi:gliding motility-associated-like protein